MPLPRTGCLLIVLLALSSANADERLEYDENSDACSVFRALNGSDAVPEECQDEDDSKSSFGSTATLTPPTPPQTLDLAALVFESNSNLLSAASQRLLSSLAEKMRHPSSQAQVYSVDGHSDSRGDPGGNLLLSARRALAVREFLVAQGVPANRLQARAFGATQPKDPQHPEAPGNRRVEINNLKR